MTVIGNPSDLPEPKDAEREMKPLDVAALNAFSAAFAAHIFQRRQEWFQFATSERGVLWVNVPSPVPGRSLWLTTENDEVTIGINPGMWHEHFNAESLGTTDMEMFNNVMEWIDEIFAEKILISEARTADGQTKSWTAVPRGGKLKPPRDRTIVLMSWRGTYDREILSGWRRWLR